VPGTPKALTTGGGVDEDLTGGLMEQEADPVSLKFQSLLAKIL
jgi:hypothetical protein